MGRTGFEGLVRVCNGATGVVVEVRLNVAGHDISQGTNQLVDLTRGRATDRVGDANAVDANLVDGLVERQKVDEVRSERILARDC